MRIMLLHNTPCCIVVSSCKSNFCPQTGKRKTHEKIAKSGVPSKSGREKSGAAKDGGKQPTEEDTKAKRIAGV